MHSRHIAQGPSRNIAAVFVACASAVILVVLGPFACGKASPTTTSPGFDVYVPMPTDTDAEAGVAADAGADAFGIGQVDRAGRPLVSVLLVPSSSQDTYNAQPTFTKNMQPGLPPQLQDGIESRLVAFDTLVLPGALDGGADADPVDWPVPEGGAHPLLPMFITDVLLVDTALPCTADDGGFASSYLDLEQEAFSFGAARPHTTCGGRTPNEPVVDETLSLLVTANRDGGPAVTQGIPSATRPATTTFPYLAPPN